MTAKAIPPIDWDSNWFERLKNNDASTWDDFFQRYESIVRFYIMQSHRGNIILPPKKVADVLQDVWLEVVKQILEARWDEADRGYRLGSTFIHFRETTWEGVNRAILRWLSLIAKTTVRKHMRSAEQERGSDIAYEAAPPVEDEAEASRLSFAIKQALEEMSPTDREIFIARIIEQRSVREIASTHGLKPTQIADILSRTTQKVRELAEQIAETEDKTGPYEIEFTSTVYFSAYYPREIHSDTRYGMHIYAHGEEAISTVEKDVLKFKDEFGGEVPTPKTAKQSAQIKQGTLITVVPECDEAEFSPISLTKKWGGSWVRFDFDFTPTDSLVGETLFVRVSIQVNGIEIAHIKCPIELTDQSARLVSTPIKAKEELSRQTARMYQKIFVSYSRKDKEVVEGYRLAQLAVGNDVFMDTYSIKTGEDWLDALEKAIEEADIFQLFWSDNSAKSRNVRYEWNYALKRKCPETKCVDFIRPVFWVDPLPVKPPRALKHLHFRYVPLKL